MQEHRNNVGVLRLLFASLVIVGHAPELIDGNRLREPMSAVFHTLSLGELSVDGFFLISGYLITRSMTRSNSLLAFLERRILRIYPAFVVSFLLSLFVLGPMSGGHLTSHLAKNAIRIILLRSPSTPDGALSGLHYPDLNGSLWTIYHEFLCYILVALLGVFGLLKRRNVILSSTLALLLLDVFMMLPGISERLSAIDNLKPVVLVLGDGGIGASLRLTAVFLVGACAFLYEHRVRQFVTARIAFICLILASLALLSKPLAETGFIIFGGATLFWIALIADFGVIRNINDRWDISYGTYLYGWPIATGILYFNRDVSPLTLASLSLVLALGAGAASWWGIERWAKDLRRPTRPTGISDGITPTALSSAQAVVRDGGAGPPAV